MPFIKYSQRLLNPFRGSMNIIEYKGAEAVTLDGIHWDIYVKNNELIKGLRSQKNVQISDIRYAHWSHKDGLKRGPIYPSDDFRKMEEQGARVYEHLLQHHEQLPFAFLDNYELWLLDKNAFPLALIDSSLRENEINNDPILDWRAGQACRNEFISETYTSIQQHRNVSAAHYLTSYINQLCSTPPQAQWFKRTLDGHGIGMTGHNISEELINRELSDTHFHAFMISDKNHDNHHINLINEFVQWQSPWLLLLDSISESQRMILEEKAQKRALIVDQLHQLYPEIIDTGLINVARVEAALRKSCTTQAKQDERILHTECPGLIPLTNK